MLTRYLKDHSTLESYRRGLAGRYLDEFIGWLEEQGYQHECIRGYIRGANRLAIWAQNTGLAVEELDQIGLGLFRRYLETRHLLKYPSGNLTKVFRGARHSVAFLAATGRLAAPATAHPSLCEPELWIDFRHWMRTQRGTADTTIKNYRLTVIDLIQTLGDQPNRYDAKALRAFVLQHANHHGVAKAKTVVTSVRMFLRFLIAMGRCTPGLCYAIPTIAQWRLASIPKYLPADAVERLIASCDTSTLIGARDRSVLLLLARLGLRAGDVAELKMRVIDWRAGTLEVAGKNRKANRLPLPQEVGDAVLQYLAQRPSVKDEHVFITTIAPFTGLAYQTVSQIVIRAIQRTGIEAPIQGAHLLRHSAATQMLRQGVSLPSIGAVLRHASIETTTGYAKVDFQMLQQVTRPWPEVASC